MASCVERCDALVGRNEDTTVRCVLFPEGVLRVFSSGLSTRSSRAGHFKSSRHDVSYSIRPAYQHASASPRTRMKGAAERALSAKLSAKDSARRVALERAALEIPPPVASSVERALLRFAEEADGDADLWRLSGETTTRRYSQQKSTSELVRLLVNGTWSSSRRRRTVLAGRRAYALGATDARRVRTTTRGEGTQRSSRDARRETLPRDRAGARRGARPDASARAPTTDMMTPRDRAPSVPRFSARGDDECPPSSSRLSRTRVASRRHAARGHGLRIGLPLKEITGCRPKNGR